MSKLETLKPCPFCGSTNIFASWRIAHYITIDLTNFNKNGSVDDRRTQTFGFRCDGCGANNRGDETGLEDAIAIWNKRATQ